MKNKITFIFILTIISYFGFMISSFISCTSDYLDRRPETEGYDFELVFGDSTNYWKYCSYLVVNPFFLVIQQNGEFPNGSWDDIGDNSMSTRYSGNIPCVQAQRGEFYTLSTNGAAKQCNEQTWGNIWRHLRVANTGIQNIEYYQGSEFTKNKILGLCFFYRAYAYMELTRRWGGMPYLTEPFLATDNMDIPRLSMQETYMKASEDFDIAAQYLKDIIPDNEFQYPTRISALAMKSRCLLYAASEQATQENHPTNPRKNLWSEAAQAADEALKAAEAAVDNSGNSYYDLVDWGTSLNGDDGYYYIFKGDDPRQLSKEVLFGRRGRIAWNSAPYVQCIRPPGQLGGVLGVGVNQLLVDCFEMKDTGLPIDEDDSGYNEQNPYVGRDPRFYFNIMYNQCQIMGLTLDIWNYDEQTNSYGSRDCQMAGITPSQGYTPTGTYAKKWMGNNFGAQLYQCWSYIRLAEVYLNFAEAANEAWGNPGAKQNGFEYSAAEALNKVRNRALMPDVNIRFLSSKEVFRTRVRNERRIEFCFEEHRLFDLRRWLIGKDPMNRDIWKVNITKLKPGYDETVYPTGFKFEKTLHIVRTYEDKHNLFVISRNDTRLGPNFNQNPGW